MVFFVNRIILVTKDLKFICIRVFLTIFSFSGRNGV